MRSFNLPFQAISKFSFVLGAFAPLTALSVRAARSLTALLVFTVCALPMWADQSLVLHSGNGSVGTQDAQVRFLCYGVTHDVTPSAQDFELVKTGTFAHIDQPYATYIQSLPTDWQAKWIGTTSNLGAGSALYAIPFTITDSAIGSASLDLGYSVDNAINGIYINGTLVSGNSYGGNFSAEYYVMRTDITQLLKPNAVNWLYVNVSDYGVLSGVIFSATVTTQAAPTPATTTTLVANPDTNLVAHEPITLTATVTPTSNPSVPTGTVTFIDPAGGSVTVPLDSMGKAVYSGVVPPAGTYSVFARYNGSTEFYKSSSAVITRTVTAPPVN